MESIYLSKAMEMENMRKRTYMDTGIPYQPRIYHLTENTLNYPKKTIKDSLFGYGYIYDTQHWMIGNIIRNPYRNHKNERRQKRNYAVWYSIDGRTSHYMTKEAFDSIAPMLKQFEIKPLVKKKIMPEENPFDNLTYKVLNEASTGELVKTVRRCLSTLCKRVNEAKQLDLDYQKTLRFAIERSIVKLIHDPLEIAGLMEHVIKEHRHIHNVGIDHNLRTRIISYDI